MWNECVKVDMKRLGLVKDDAHNRGKWRSLTTGNRPTLPQCGNAGVVFMDCVLVMLNVSNSGRVSVYHHRIFYFNNVALV